MIIDNFQTKNIFELNKPNKTVFFAKYDIFYKNDPILLIHLGELGQAKLSLFKNQNQLNNGLIKDI